MAALDALQMTIGETRTGAFASTARHLGALLYYYNKGEPDSYASDINDLYGQDLPGVATAVEKWLDSHVDARLLAAIARSWTSQQYASAIRDAFICLEAELKVAAQLTDSRGLSGDKLVTSAFRSQEFLRKISRGTPMGELDKGQEKGLEYSIRGAFLLYRNATAHREVPYTTVEAERVILLIDRCLRFIPPSI